MFAVNALQLALATGAVLLKSAKDGMGFGFGTSVHDTTYDAISWYRERGVVLTPPWVKHAECMYVSSDGPNEDERNEECQCIYGGMKRCIDFAGLEFHPHGHARFRKAAGFPSVKPMTLPNLMYALRVINELQTECSDNHLLGCLVEAVRNHRIKN